MNRRTLIAAGLTLLSLALLCCAFVQRHKLTELRAEQQRSNAQQEALRLSATAAAPVQPANADGATGQASVSSELLKLRAEVSRLTQRRDELAHLDAENQELKTRIAASVTNGTSSGYIRKSQAKFVGYDSPEHTLQTFLWAIQNKDAARFLETLTPQVAQALRQDQQASGKPFETLFVGAEALVGFGILETRRVADDHYSVQVQIHPDVPPEEMSFFRIGGEWKMGPQNLPNFSR